MNKISVLASWKPAFSLNKNSWMGGYQRFFITVPATRPLQNLRKHSWKHRLSVKFRLAAYAFIRYDFIGLILSMMFLCTSIQRCFTLLHWTVWHSLAMIYCCMRLEVRIDRLSMFIKQFYALKTKVFIPISFDDSLFWFLLLVWNLEKQTKSAGHSCRTATLQSTFAIY